MSISLGADLIARTMVKPDQVADQYAAPGVGDCLEPLIPADALLAFDKRQPVQSGDIAVFWFTDEAARRHGMPGWVKRLASPLPPPGFVGIITVEMLNPHRKLTLRSTDLLAVHKCIGLATPRDRRRALLQPMTFAVPIGSDTMPTDEKPTPSPTLEIFNRVPAWAIAHAAEDGRMAPLIHQGEVAIVESNGKAGWYPVDGGLFLIEYVSSPSERELYERRTRSIVVTKASSRLPGAWFAAPLSDHGGGMLYMSDGPYRDEEALASKLIGKVVGIYAPAGHA